MKLQNFLNLKKENVKIIFRGPEITRQVFKGGGKFNKEIRQSVDFLVVGEDEKVLFGSATECFQPTERRYQITRRILEILNKYKIYYVILIRLPYITDYVSLLKEGFCRKIYFTVNKFSNEFKLKLESQSPTFNMRNEAVNILLEQGLPIVPYFSPVFPWVSDIKGIFLEFKKTKLVEFEC